MHKPFLAFLTAFFLLAAGAAASQSRTGKVQGTVQDESKALVPGARITLTNTDTNAVQSTISTRTGEYALEASAGVYELKVELPGFQTIVVPRVELTTSQAVRLDLVLYLAGRTAPQR